MNKKPKKPLNTYAKYSGILFQMIAIVFIGSFIGVKLDQKFPNEHSAYTIIVSFCSVVVSVYFVIKQINSFSKDDEG